MLGMMGDEKKKASVIIGIMNKKKEGPMPIDDQKIDQNPLVEKVFSSLSEGDKIGFQDALRLLVKEMIYDLEMAEDKEEE